MPRSTEICFHTSHMYFSQTLKDRQLGRKSIGKTTPFRLILGFIELTCGLGSISSELCFVSQGNTLMSGTIRNNLQQTTPDATGDELR